MLWLLKDRSKIKHLKNPTKGFLFCLKKLIHFSFEFHLYPREKCTCPTYTSTTKIVENYASWMLEGVDDMLKKLKQKLVEQWNDMLRKKSIA